MPIPQPQHVETALGSDPVAAGNLALNTNWSILQYADITNVESSQHLQRVKDVRQMFTAAAGVFAGGVEQLDKASQRLRETWQDDNYHRAYGDPVEGYKKQLQDAQKKLGEGEHIKALDDTAMAIDDAAKKVPPLRQEYDTVRSRLEANVRWLASIPTLGRAAPESQEVINQIWGDIQRLGQIDQDAFTPTWTMDLKLTAAAILIQRHAEVKFDGPSAAAPPTGRTTTRNPGPSPSPSPGGPSGDQPGGEQPGGEQPGGQQGGEQAGGEQAGGEQAGGEQAGGEQGAEQPGGATGGELPGDTGLSGGPATTIPPTTVPDLPGTSPYTPSTPSPVPTGSSGSSGGLGGIGGVGAGGLGSAGIGGPGTRQPSGGGNSAIQQAARQYSSSPAAATGQAPSLSGLASKGAAGQAGAGMGGVPPMMPPMMPQGGGSGNVKPGTAQSAGVGRNRPAGATPGVPNGLRGRTGKSEHAARAAGRRTRRDAPEKVERLDSELWDVDR